MKKFVFLIKFILFSLYLNAQHPISYKCLTPYSQATSAVLKAEEIKLLWKIETYTAACRENFNRLKSLIGSDPLLDKISGLVDKAYSGGLSQKGEVVFQTLPKEPYKNSTVLIVADTAVIFHTLFYGDSLSDFLKTKHGTVLGKGNLGYCTSTIFVRHRDSWISEAITCVHEFYHLYLRQYHTHYDELEEEEVIRVYTASLLLKIYNRGADFSLISAEAPSLNSTLAKSSSVDEIVFDINDKFGIVSTAEGYSDIKGEIYFYYLVKQLKNTVRECEIKEYLKDLGYGEKE